MTEFTKFCIFLCIMVIVISSIILICCVSLFGNIPNTSNIITKNITITDMNYHMDSYGFSYFSVIDADNHGYYFIDYRLYHAMITGIGKEYIISYYCDKDNIRRIVSIKDISKNIYTCDVGECNNG